MEVSKKTRRRCPVSGKDRIYNLRYTSRVPAGTQVSVEPVQCLHVRTVYFEVEYPHVFFYTGGCLGFWYNDYSVLYAPAQQCLGWRSAVFICNPAQFGVAKRASS